MGTVMLSSFPAGSGARAGHEVCLAGQGGQRRSTAVNKSAGNHIGAVQLVRYWVLDLWDKPRDLATVGLADERGAACFEIHTAFWHKGYVICRSVRLGRAHLGLKQAFPLPELLTAAFQLPLVGCWSGQAQADMSN